MRAVVQRVVRAEVRIAGEVVGSIGRGLLVLVGVTNGDTTEDSNALADKLVGLRIFPDQAGKMNRSVVDIEGAVLVVSQFTLHADLRKGRRPSFVEAAHPEKAEPLIEAVVERMQRAVPTATGRFGAAMEIDLVNDGPVTIIIDVNDGRVL